MADELFVRECHENEAEAVLVVWRQADTTVSQTDTIKDIQRAINWSGTSVLVAESRGRLVGTVIGTFDGWQGNIYRLEVLPDFRRRGVAHKLVAEAEKRMAELGARRITALVERESTLGPPATGTPQVTKSTISWPGTFATSN